MITNSYDVKLHADGVAKLAVRGVRLEARRQADGRLTVAAIEQTSGARYQGEFQTGSVDARRAVVAALEVAGIVVAESALAALEEALSLESEFPPTDESAASADNNTQAAAKGYKEAAATAIVRLAQDVGIELFHSPSDEAYMSIPINGHLETYSLKSKSCRDFLARLYYEHAGKAPNTTAVQDARQTLGGIARFDGAQREVFLRTATHGDAIYYDLGDPTWAVIEVTAHGWREVANPPVRFRRPNGMHAVPRPERGGDLRKLPEFINLGTEDDFILSVAWMLGAMRPPSQQTGIYPVLVVTGEEGSAKSSACRGLRNIIDPVDAPLRAAPKDERDLMVAGLNGHVMVFDNVSKVPESMSDVLCRVAMGAALSTRQLYSDDEETVLKAHRPIVLNGITDFVTKGDLASRSIALKLPTIPDSKRRREQDIHAAFEREHPRLLGALFDALVVGLARKGTAALPELPRLADFAAFIVAAEPALPWAEGAFMRAFKASQEDAVYSVLEGNALADAVRALPPTWNGTYKQLIEDGKLNPPGRKEEWNAKRVSGELTRLMPSLRKIGVVVTLPSNGRLKGRPFNIDRDGSVAGQDGRSSGSVPTVRAETTENRPNSAAADGRDGRDGVFPTFLSEGSGSAVGGANAVEI